MARPGGCFDAQSQSVVVDGNETVNFTLPARHDSFGYTCVIEGAGYVEGDTSLPLSGARAAEVDDRREILRSAACRGWLMMLAGETAAEEQFEAADRIQHTDDPDDHLYSIEGVWWGTFLARTGRAGPAQRLTGRNRAISVENGWNGDVGRCDRLLGQLDLLRADTATSPHPGSCAPHKPPH